MFSKLFNFGTNFIIPWWVKYVAMAIAALALVSFGYIKGIDHEVNQQNKEVAKVVYLQGKVTTKVITKYIKQEQKIKEQGDKLKQEGQSYAIQFPNDHYIFNNYFVSLYDSSITDSIPSLSEGNSSEPSGVGVSQVLQSAINNNTAGRLWEQRAKSCEEWVKNQEELNVK